MESTSKTFKQNLPDIFLTNHFFKAVGAVTTFNRGCRIGTCNTGDCKSCSKNLCNTLKGDASFSAGSFSFTGFILLITVSLWKSF